MTTADDLLVEAEDALDRGEVMTAAALLERAVELGSRDAVFNLGNVEYSRGRYERAAELHLRALEEGDEDALLNLANDLLALGRWEEARDRFRQALDELGDERALVGLAEALEALDEPEAAITALRRAADAGVDNARWLLAATLARHDEVPEALQLWAAAALDDPEALVSRGVFFRDEGDYDRAVSDFRAALGRGAVSAHLYLASTYRLQERFDLAERHYRLAAGSEYEGDAMHDLAGMYAELGRLADADAAFARAAELGVTCAEDDRRALWQDSEGPDPPPFVVG